MFFPLLNIFMGASKGFTERLASYIESSVSSKFSIIVRETDSFTHSFQNVPTNRYRYCSHNYFHLAISNRNNKRIIRKFLE